jgi:hypothetical protein
MSLEMAGQIAWKLLARPRPARRPFSCLRFIPLKCWRYLDSVGSSRSQTMSFRRSLNEISCLHPITPLGLFAPIFRGKVDGKQFSVEKQIVVWRSDQQA